MENIDFTVVPEEAWNSLVQWYTLTEGQEPIARKVIDQGIFNKNCNIEIYLIDLKLCHHSNIDSPETEYFSRMTTLEQVEKTMRKLFNISDDKEVRLWSKYMNNMYEQLKRLSNTLQEASLYPGQVILIEEKNANGTWPRQEKHHSIITSSGAIGDVPVTRNYSGSSEVVYDSSYSNNGYRSSFTPGLCGLNNLGNTCFMNSAIQCLSNVPSLTEYMLSGQWKEELNCENPLGMHGEIASSYAELIKNMWSGKNATTVPRQFKVAVGHFKPEFSGYQQQDSQELMAFLLDGLHEDLNRIRKKPYIETKEADNRPDEEVAMETWQDYTRRNNSVIVDIFHGLLKSTLVCPECSKVSVKFDPFCYLSLPLPVKKERQMTVFFVPLNPKLNIRQCKLTLPKMGVIGDLCHAVAVLTGAPQDKLVVADVYNHRFHKFFLVQEQLSHITEKDDIFVYEVPINALDDPDTIVLPVYMRETRGKSGHNNIGYTQLFGQPLLIPLPRNNCTYDVVYKALLDRMVRFIHCPESSNSSSSVSLSEEDSSSSLEKEDNINNCDNDACNNTNESDESGVKNVATDVNSMELEGGFAVPEKKARMFILRLVNSFGSTDLDEISDDGIPIKFNNHSYIAADWTSKAKELYYDEKEAEAFIVDESMHQRPAPKKTIQLTDCLQLFTTMEKLGEQDPWYCPACKKHQQATKKFDIWNLPKILVIHLKRFSYNRYWRDKLDTFIDYPVKDLDMSEFVINPKRSPALYDLIAVSNHYGGMGVGHYTAYAKNKDLNQWFYFDDSSVTKASEESVVTKAGYVLVYQLKTSNRNSNSLTASSGSTKASTQTHCEIAMADSTTQSDSVHDTMDTD